MMVSAGSKTHNSGVARLRDFSDKPMAFRVLRLILDIPPIVLAIMVSFSAALAADQGDPRLDELFKQIRQAGSPQEAQEIERNIWRIWVVSGDSTTNKLMAHGIEALTTNNLDVAIGFFTKIIERSPGFAEGWNKRATAHYLNGDFAASVEDIERTLALEPRHFGALEGMALIFLKRGDEIGALSAFERVLEINPYARGARIYVPRLRDSLKGQGA